jgi:hypothetical protein
MIHRSSSDYVVGGGNNSPQRSIRQPEQQVCHKETITDLMSHSQFQRRKKQKRNEERRD